MEGIAAFFDNMDFTKLVPDLSTLLGRVQAAVTLALLVGPVLMLVFGLWFFFLPMKEANHHIGFRTWFGMGTVEAWRYTQRIAGIVWICLGAVLTAVMGIVCLVLIGKDLMTIANTAFICLAIEAGLAVLSYVILYFLPLKRFDISGYRK